MKELFHDKSIYNKFKRIYVSNLEIFYPSIKIRLNKSMKIAEKECLNICEPHVVVFVHGLGATSSAFSEFETFFKNLYGKNIFILNSTCN
jgi:triacylglycerol esterase/lipase EstA (alpha/beta hydrolase family)